LLFWRELKRAAEENARKKRFCILSFSPLFSKTAMLKKCKREGESAPGQRESERMMPQCTRREAEERDKKKEKARKKSKKTQKSLTLKVRDLLSYFQRERERGFSEKSRVQDQT